MKRTKSNTKLWKYLDQNNVDVTDVKTVTEMKKRFYREYDRELKQQKRKAKRTFVVSFPNNQIHHIRKHAKQYSHDIPSYIKILVTADICDTSVEENIMVYREVFQLLQYYKNTIDAIEAKESSRWLGNNDYETLYKILSSIKDKITIKKK